jgi:hypothetical protein
MLIQLAQWDAHKVLNGISIMNPFLRFYKENVLYTVAPNKVSAIVTTLLGLYRTFFMVLYKPFIENGSIKNLSQSQRFFVEQYRVFILV